MIYISAQLLKPGMVLARNIPGKDFMMPLVAEGVTLNFHLIERIKKRHVSGVYIKSNFSSDVGEKEIIEPKFKQKILSDIKREFDNYAQKKGKLISLRELTVFSTLASKLVSNMASKEHLLFSILDIRDFDTYTYEHSLYVATLSAIIGKNMGLSDAVLQDITLCGLLHDIGKLQIPLNIINKPGPLTEEEFIVIKEHPTNIEQYISPSLSCPAAVLQGIKAHHERYDGLGYPFGLKGQDIPLLGRILALADVFDALSSTRPYRGPWPGEKIIDYMIGSTGGHFDPEIVPCFLKSVIVYPTGAFVRLDNGWYGLVVKNTEGFPLRPVVQIVSPASYEGSIIDLSVEYMDITIQDMAADDEVAQLLQHFDLSGSE